jgi:hypothetical protein
MPVAAWRGMSQEDFYVGLSTQAAAIFRYTAGTGEIPWVQGKFLKSDLEMLNSGRFCRLRSGRLFSESVSALQSN